MTEGCGENARVTVCGITQHFLCDHVSVKSSNSFIFIQPLPTTTIASAMADILGPTGILMASSAWQSKITIVGRGRMWLMSAFPRG